MNLKRLERRDSSMDLIRIVAVFLVMSVHFLYHTSKTVENTAKMGFYNLTVDGFGPIEGIVKYFQTGDPTALHGPVMFLLVMMKVLFSACVPLFMILTGYLMSQKTLSRKYYLGIRKTLIVFVLATFICMTFKSINLVPAAKTAFEHFDLQGMFEAIDATHKYDLKHFILSIFDFSGANYAWYVEMYIGLFLIAPFLNLAYNKLESQRKKQVLVATLVVLTILPSLINAFRFDSAEWWLKPISKTKGYQKLIPSFWMGAMYPVAYYFTGAYIREYGIKLKTRSMLALFGVMLFLCTAFSFYRSYGGTFQSGSWIFWYGVEPFIIATLLFVLLSRVRANNWHPAVRTVMWKISDVTFGMYLLSFIFDLLIYNGWVNVAYENIYQKLPLYVITVPLCFMCSLAASLMTPVEGSTPYQPVMLRGQTRASPSATPGTTPRPFSTIFSTGTPPSTHRQPPRRYSGTCRYSTSGLPPPHWKDSCFSACSCHTPDRHTDSADRIRWWWDRKR